MTVQTNTTVATGIGNGVTSVFPIPFKFNRAEDLIVYLVIQETEEEIPLTLHSDYTVTGAGNENGGNLTMLAGPLPVGQSVVAQRIVDLRQLTDLRNQGRFFAEVHEDVFDKLVMIDQQQQTHLDRAMVVDLLWRWNALNRRIINVGDPIADKDAAHKRYVDQGDNDSRSYADSRDAHWVARTLRTADPLSPLPGPETRAGKLLSFDSTGRPVVVAPEPQSATELALQLANPDKGAAMVARGVVAVDSIADLLALPAGQRKEGLRYLVKGYRAGSTVGGGEFYWAPDVNNHNGITSISPSVPADISTPAGLVDFIAADATSPGCFVKLTGDRLDIVEFGVSAGWDISGVLQVAPKNLLQRMQFSVPTRIDSPVQLDMGGMPLSWLFSSGATLTIADGLSEHALLAHGTEKLFFEEIGTTVPARSRTLTVPLGIAEQIEKGDLIRVHSRDLIADCRDAFNYRSEHVEVVGVVGQTVYLRKSTIQSYETQVAIDVYSPLMSPTIDGIEVVHEGTSLGVEMRNGINPVIRHSINTGGSSGLCIRDSINGRIIKSESYDCNHGNGYGLHLAGPTRGALIDCGGDNNRHTIEVSGSALHVKIESPSVGVDTSAGISVHPGPRYVRIIGGYCNSHITLRGTWQQIQDGFTLGDGCYVSVGEMERTTGTVTIFNSGERFRAIGVNFGASHPTAGHIRFTHPPVDAVVEGCRMPGNGDAATFGGPCIVLQSFCNGLTLRDNEVTDTASVVYLFPVDFARTYSDRFPASNRRILIEGNDIRARDIVASPNNGAVVAFGDVRFIDGLSITGQNYLSVLRTVVQLPQSWPFEYRGIKIRSNSIRGVYSPGIVIIPTKSDSQPVWVDLDIGGNTGDSNLYETVDSVVDSNGYVTYSPSIGFSTDTAVNVDIVSKGWDLPAAARYAIPPSTNASMFSGYRFSLGTAAAGLQVRLRRY